MQQHPEQDDLPAYALGALEAEEARLVGGHLAICSRCRAIVKAYYAVICLLPYAAPPQSPPARLRWRLLASVAADQCSDRTHGRSMMNEHADCRDEPVEQPLDEAALASANAVYLAVQGMGCPHCAMRVRKGLLGLEGALAAEIFLVEGLALVAYDPARVVIDDLVAAVTAASNDDRHHYQAQVIGHAPPVIAFAQCSNATV